MVLGTINNSINDNKKTALYIRVSTEAQFEEGYSVEAMTEVLLAQCTVKGLTNYELFTDGGYSGSNLNRPEIQRLITEVQDGLIGCVMVYKLDRLSRSQKDTLYLIEDIFMPNNVDFISVNESLDTSTPYGRAMIGILSAFAQLERENIYLRTREGMRKRVESGLWIGGATTPRCYDYDPDLNILVKNEKSFMVDAIADLLIEGKTIVSIQRKFGLKYADDVVKMMRNKTYTGVIVYKGNEIKGQHEPLISMEKWEQVQIILNSHKKVSSSNATYLLTGLMVCGYCNAKMRYQKWDKKIAVYCYSKDSKSHLIKDPNCPSKTYWAKDIEEAVVNNMLNFSLNLENEDGEMENDNSNKILENLQRKERLLTEKIKRLYNLYAESSDDILLDTIKENKDDLEHVAQQIEIEKNKAAFTIRSQDIRSEIKDMKNIWFDLDRETQKLYLQKMIKQITIKDDEIHVEYII